MVSFVVFVSVLVLCSGSAGLIMSRRGEAAGLWAALGLGLGPFVFAYAYAHGRQVPAGPPGPPLPLR